MVGKKSKKEKQTKIETWCPIFSGFYGTIWESDGDEENFLYEEGKSWDDYDWEYSRYREDVSRAFVSAFEDKIREILPSILKVNLQNISSPREYNFYNDSLNVEIVVSAEFFPVLKEYIHKHHKEWGQYLRYRYTSYDGFLSSYRNYPEAWEEYTHDFTDFGDNGHYLGSVLEFICRNEGIEEFEDFYETVMDGIWIGEYATPKAEEKV